MADIRPLDELLKMDSYEDMTAEEVDAVVEWRVTMAAAEAREAARAEAEREKAEGIVATLKETEQAARERFDALVSGVLDV